MNPWLLYPNKWQVATKMGCIKRIPGRLIGGGYHSNGPFELSKHSVRSFSSMRVQGHHLQKWDIWRPMIALRPPKPPLHFLRRGCAASPPSLNQRPSAWLVKAANVGQCHMGRGWDRKNQSPFWKSRAKTGKSASESTWKSFLGLFLGLFISDSLAVSTYLREKP